MKLDWRATSAPELRAWFYFGFMLVFVCWQAFSVVPLSNAITLSHFTKHACAMAVLCGFLHYPLLLRGRDSTNMMYLRIFVVILSYGLFIEFVQSFLPWRAAEFIDVIADLVGILLYFIVVAVSQRLGIWPDIKKSQ